MVDFGDIWEVFQVVARERGLCVMHGEDNDIVMHMYEKLIREGRVGFEHMAEVHLSVNSASERYRQQERRHNYTTPKSYLELIPLAGHHVMQDQPKELNTMIKKFIEKYQPSKS